MRSEKSGNAAEPNAGQAIPDDRPFRRVPSTNRNLALIFAAIAIIALPALALGQSTRGDRPIRPTAATVVAVGPETPETVVISKPGQTVEIPGKLKVGGGSMEVVTSPIGGGVLTSNLYIRQLNQAGSPAHLCWKVAPDHTPGLLLTTCTTSQSSLRYKTDLHPFLGGLNIVNRLNPVNFEWKNGGFRDLGLVAEEVAAVEPLLTFNNAQGQVEGVKYETLSVVVINAIKEQQTQITELQKQIQAQQEQIKRQQQQIEALLKAGAEKSKQ
jgi:hypothetical protein